MFHLVSDEERTKGTLIVSMSSSSLSKLGQTVIYWYNTVKFYWKSELGNCVHISSVMVHFYSLYINNYL
jgi:hypothetical protein